MNKNILIFFSVALCSSPVFASEGLARQKNCIACHAADRKLVGPAFNAIAEKYLGVAGAESKLVDKVLRGGVGVWGSIPMPANSSLTAADARILVRWILSSATAQEAPSVNVSPPQASQESKEMSLSSAKAKCSDLGFQSGTEKFGECVLRLTK